jgi:hypothetical protein
MFFAVLATGCNKPDTVGLNLLPDGDAINVSFFDTLTIETSYLPEDTLRTDAHLLYQINSSNFNFLIGHYVDPVFGPTSAELFTQLKPASTFDNANRSYDSLFLNLAYISNYGDTADEQTFEVYELDDVLSDTATYYSFNNFAYSTKVGELTFKVQDVNDSIKENDSTYLAPRMRFKLDDALGQRIFTNAATYLNDINNFKNQIKGFCIKPSASSSGSIITFDAKSIISSMVMYYSDAATPGLDSLPFYIYSTDGTIARSSRFTHDYSGFDFANPQQDIAYVQSMCGIRTKISIPYTEQLRSLGPIAINKAELVVTLASGTTADFAANDLLSLVGIDSTGSLQIIPDQSRSASLFGGTLTNNQYRFNIAQFLQQVLYGKRTNYGLYLRAPLAAQTPNRAVVSGGDSNASMKMKLQITYTKLNP